MSSKWDPPTDPGSGIPADTLHGVSVLLPTWESVVAYEDGADWLISRMRSAYPRFYLHYKIKDLIARLESMFGRQEETCLPFMSLAAAQRCQDYLKRVGEVDSRVDSVPASGHVAATVFAVFFAKNAFSTAKEFWQLTGDGASSRFAEYVLAYSDLDGRDETQKEFADQRIRKHNDLTKGDEAKQIVRARIASQLSKHLDFTIDESHVYLTPAGMSAIYLAHRVSMLLHKVEEQNITSVCFGFPYRDTLSILQKWGPGVEFYPGGTDEELDKFEALLESGVRVASFVCEVPSNPLLKTPNVKRIRALANKHGFLVIIDDTIGNIFNVNVLKYADIVVSSLTKIFNGACNVMSGSFILNPESKFYADLLAATRNQFSDDLWAEDAIILERNSHDVALRNEKANSNAEAVVELLRAHPLVKTVYYPKYSATRANYDALKLPEGGYGGLLSVSMNSHDAAVAFYDGINVFKGPSLGTNFTLACPYPVIAHYREMDFVETCGVDRDLVRISIGLEDRDDLISRISTGLQMAKDACASTTIDPEVT